MRLLDNYRHAARLESRPEAARQLIEIALTGEFPEHHPKILEVIRQFEELEVGDRVDKETRTEQVGITFPDKCLSVIDEYKRQSLSLTCRAAAIRKLMFLPIAKKFPKEHLSIVKAIRQRRLAELLA